MINVKAQLANLCKSGPSTALRGRRPSSVDSPRGLTLSGQSVFLPAFLRPVLPRPEEIQHHSISAFPTASRPADSGPEGRWHRRPQSTRSSWVPAKPFRRLVEASAEGSLVSAWIPAAPPPNEAICRSHPVESEDEAARSPCRRPACPERPALRCWLPAAETVP